MSRGSRTRAPARLSPPGGTLKAAHVKEWEEEYDPITERDKAPTRFGWDQDSSRWGWLGMLFEEAEEGLPELLRSLLPGSSRCSGRTPRVWLGSGRRLPFRAVLMDAWYATKKTMLLIDGMGKTFYCPLKSNRQVDDPGGERPYRRVDVLDWSKQELKQGKLTKIKGFPKDHKAKLFRVVVSSDHTE